MFRASGLVSFFCPLHPSVHGSHEHLARHHAPYREGFATGKTLLNLERALHAHDAKTRSKQSFTDPTKDHVAVPPLLNHGDWMGD